MGLIGQQQKDVFELKDRLIRENLSKMEALELSMSEWRKKLPSKISQARPERLSAAELVSRHHGVLV